ncbi:MAG TPA: MXAN_5808 family serine peptidase [Myxococcaceae bacterium]|nr:MXAN_5808 family serine peptidase [Myxococcaceae bacterium]
MFRRVFAILVLLGAWALVATKHAPIPVTVNEAVAGTSRFDTQDTPRAGEKPTHDLSSLRIFTKVILYVKDNYVDPKRVKPKEMMISALEYVEKTVPDVIVDGSADTGKLKVTVGNKVQNFDISHVDSLWKMSFLMKDVFRFINENMRPMEDTRDVEYAAVNGMLSKLDPHSVLLRPELYREMKLTTKGEFGGLGFVIQMKEGNLTVVRVLPKTPAAMKGIKKDDQIKRIGEESTVNMDLNEAVSKLRGPVDSKVTITVERKGWEKPQQMTLSRAMISIESVQSKLLAGNVGYVRLKNFQGNTTRDLQSALQRLGREAEASGGMKGLVLDMRGNPGGLLEQAIQVSDQFLSKGTLVATVGMADKLREEKHAREDDDDLRYPMAVLVNSGSASASEIVAGALKNLNRAVIIGRQTFGKGSVQVLYDFPDDSALKLTIAKYLTPGDVSIQETGIVPDIDLVPTRVTKDRVDVFAPRKSMGEADLESHFGNPNEKSAATKREEVLNREKAREVVKYLKEDSKQKDASAKQQLAEEGKAPKTAQKPDPSKGPAKYNPLTDTETPATDDDLDDQLDAESQDEIKEDFEVLFAKEFVLKMPFLERDKMLQQGKGFVDQKRREEEERINNAITALGVDWSTGGAAKHPNLVTTLKPGADQRLAAGEPVELEVTVENRGTEPVKRLRAWTECPDNAYLDRREFLFGAIKPGEKKTWKVSVKLPKDLTSRRDAVAVKLQDDNGLVGDGITSEVNFVELPRPSFAFNWQILDGCDSGCNGDGLVQRGETVEVMLDVTNVGTGKALDSFAQIKNGADQYISIEKGRFKLGEMAPGETKTARFILEVKKGYRGESFPLKLAIIDEPLEEFATERLVVPVQEDAVPVEAKKTAVKVAEKAELFTAPTEDGRAFARLPKGALLNGVAKVGNFVKVEVDKDRFAFVKATDAKDSATKPKASTLPTDTQYLAARTPPRITLGNVDPAQGGVVADGERFTLSGTAVNDKNQLDLYVLVNDQKVFFQTLSTQPGEPATIKFTTDFALKEGNNHVLVVARESQDFASRKTLVIRRRPATPAVAQKQGAAAPVKVPQKP